MSQLRDIQFNKIYVNKYNDSYAKIPLEIDDTQRIFNIKCLELRKYSEGKYILNTGRMGTSAGGGILTGIGHTDNENFWIWYELDEKAEYIGEMK